ncbi:hydrogenase maturation protease [Rhodococcus sp. ABRD24]|uniref:hydrogenase maturation protease n=1 Tax=Rhodococcus sp. ABRD24 TaxID=2507582 RepID=UPI00103D4B77|nr:hydrogenase maturation protease [Rhodococcus sp. ABRD24]QBJ96114.1 hydrogenase maturation protease [Rhodococcus sp. ABRD24]
MSPETTHRILLAGIGNIFLGDDGFGPAVLGRVAAGPLPTGVRAVDYGIGGMHLAYDLLGDWDALILVDAVPGRGNPGAVRVFEVDPGKTGIATQLDAHAMDPGSVFASVEALGGTLPRTIVVGCQAACVAEGIGLSAPVAAAVDGAIEAIGRLLSELGADAPERCRTVGSEG